MNPSFSAVRVRAAALAICAVVALAAGPAHASSPSISADRSAPLRSPMGDDWQDLGASPQDDAAEGGHGSR